LGKLKKLLLPGILLAAVYYAVFGGEYSVFALRRARKEATKEEASLRELHHRIDSMQAWVDSLKTDSATLERIARERYGMVRDGETLYRFAEPDDSAHAADADSSNLPDR